MKNKVTYSQPSIEIENFCEDVVLSSPMDTTKDIWGNDSNDLY